MPELLHILNILTMNLLFFGTLSTVIAFLKWRNPTLKRFSFFTGALFFFLVASIFEDSLKFPGYETSPIWIINLLILAGHSLFMFGAPGFLLSFSGNNSYKAPKFRAVAVLLFLLLIPGFFVPIRFWQESAIIAGAIFVFTHEFIHFFRSDSGSHKKLFPLVKLLVTVSTVALPLIFVETLRNYHEGKTLISLTLYSLFLTLTLIRIYYVQFKRYEQETQNSRIETLAHRHELSSREQEILTHMLDGLTNNEVAEKVNISHRTVETHSRNILKKFAVQNRSQLFAKIYKS